MLSSVCFPTFLKDQYSCRPILLFYNTTFFLEQRSTIHPKKAKVSSEIKICEMGEVFQRRAVLTFKHKTWLWTKRSLLEAVWMEWDKFVWTQHTQSHSDEFPLSCWHNLCADFQCQFILTNSVPSIFLKCLKFFSMSAPCKLSFNYSSINWEESCWDLDVGLREQQSYRATLILLYTIDQCHSGHVCWAACRKCTWSSR